MESPAFGGGCLDFARDETYFARDVTYFDRNEADCARDDTGRTRYELITRASSLIPRYSFGTCPLSAVIPDNPPRPIVSTADDGTITIEPFSLIAS